MQGGWRQSIEGFLAALLLLIVWATTAFAQKPAGKPRVPPGVDPGGVAVAVIGNGIDYTRPQIAARLARDGEGEIIGWDFIDNDRKPYAVCSHRTGGHIDCDQGPFLIVNEVAPHTRFVVTRVSSSAPQMLVEAMKLIAGTGTRLVVLGERIPVDTGWKFAMEAGRRFPDHVFVVPEPPPANTAGAAAYAPVNVFVSRWVGDVAGAIARELAKQPGITASALRQALAAPELDSMPR